MKKQHTWAILSLGLALFGATLSGCNSQPEPAAETGTHKEGDGHDHKEGEKD